MLAVNGSQKYYENRVKLESCRGLRTISYCTACTKRQDEWYVFSSREFRNQATATEYYVIGKYCLSDPEGWGKRCLGE